MLSKALYRSVQYKVEAFNSRIYGTILGIHCMRVGLGAFKVDN